MKKKSSLDENAQLERAIEIAVEAHRGQTDYNGTPYLLHPLRMMTRATTISEKIVAVLHDVVEDSEWTLQDLQAEGFSEKIVAAVERLTKRDGEEYDKFVKRAAGHPLSRAVKLLDLDDNMDVKRLLKVDEKTNRRLAKYLRAWHALQK